jgi:exosome complex component RRP40
MESHYYLPGDSVSDYIAKNSESNDSITIKLGKGLFSTPQGECLVVLPGYISHPPATKKGNSNIPWSISSHGRFYYPSINDTVIGVIRKRYTDTYLVDINTPKLACLSVLDFDGATKRNRPELEIGDAVYGKITSCSNDTEPIITCLNQKTEQNAQDTQFGPLVNESNTGQQNAVIFECTPYLCQYLAKPKCPILDKLGELYRFDILVSSNGRVWISVPKTSRSFNIVMIVKCILSCDQPDLLTNESIVSHLDAWIEKHLK